MTEALQVAGPVLTEVDRLREQRDLLELRVRQLEFDAMTGLLRRDVGIERMVRLCQRRLCSVVLVDVDGLKRHNDVAFQQGDWAIEVAARATVQVCRSGDLAIRWGGDKMVLCLADADAAAAAQVAQRIRDAVRTASSGLVSVSCGHAQQKELLGKLRGSEQAILTAVDLAHHQASDEKRGRSTVAAPAVHLFPVQLAAIEATPEARRILAGRSSEADVRALLGRSESLMGEANEMAAGSGSAARAVSLCADLAALVCIKARQVDDGARP